MKVITTFAYLGVRILYGLIYKKGFFSYFSTGKMFSSLFQKVDQTFKTKFTYREPTVNFFAVQITIWYSIIVPMNLNKGGKR